MAYLHMHREREKIRIRHDAHSWIKQQGRCFHTHTIHIPVMEKAARLTGRMIHAVMRMTLGPAHQGDRDGACRGARGCGEGEGGTRRGWT